MAENGNKTIGIVGARGHTGAELIRLIAAHPQFELAFVSSRELDGQPVSAHVPEYGGGLRYANIPASELASHAVDACVLALPNGHAAACVGSFAAAGADPVIVELAADHRYLHDWHCGLAALTLDRFGGHGRLP